MTASGSRAHLLQLLKFEKQQTKVVLNLRFNALYITFLFSWFLK